jgi:hypothetical protein
MLHWCSSVSLGRRADAPSAHPMREYYLVPVNRSKLDCQQSEEPMNADQTQPSGPDLTKGIDAALLADGAMLLDHIGQDHPVNGS